MPLYLIVERGAPGVGDDLRANATAALEDARDGGLVRATRARDLPGTNALMHVASAATDERLVDLDLSAESIERAHLHGQPNPMEHEPSGLLGDPERSPQLVRGDPVLRVGRKPHGRQPLVEAQRRVLEDRPDLDAELFLTALALPDPARLEVGVLSSLAARANRAVRPAEVGYQVDAYIPIREVPDRL